LSFLNRNGDLLTARPLRHARQLLLLPAKYSLLSTRHLPRTDSHNILFRDGWTDELITNCTFPTGTFISISSSLEIEIATHDKLKDLLRERNDTNNQNH
jgi:hypothetical protein